MILNVAIGEFLINLGHSLLEDEDAPKLMNVTLVADCLECGGTHLISADRHGRNDPRHRALINAMHSLQPEEQNAPSANLQQDQHGGGGKNNPRRCRAGN